MKNQSKPILLGGFGEKKFGKQYRQGNRVYSSDGIAMCITSNPVGNVGGYSYLYVVNVQHIKINKTRRNDRL